MKTSICGRQVVLAGASALLVALSGATAQAAGYRVFPLPVASPDHGPRELVFDPADAQASPFGWHDTNGIAGPEFTVLRGNNVWVYVDQNADGAPDGPGPDGGAGLVFDYPAAPGVVPPLTYAEALATNAFYWGNSIHDILWHHGFREADGNFQENNYGNGGLGGDAMRIEILYGGGTNNATNTYTADGVAPRMRTYIWNMTNPHREGSFQAEVMAWTYMQVVQRRLGGQACFGNAENPAIGVSDFFGTLITNDFAATTPATPRGTATWLMGQPLDGQGIRAYPYTTDMTVNPLTYADSAGAPTHRIGTIYGSVLWDLAWGLVQREGASGNMVSGDGGENRMLRLLVQALKVQPCDAGLVDARDALLAADQSLYGGAYHCEIWGAFARRGLGFSADQGSAMSVNDNVPAFDMAPACFIFANGFEPLPVEPVWSQHCAAPGPIPIPGSGPASVYPVQIPVAGIATPLLSARVQVFGLSHTWPSDIDMLLVGPDGRQLIVQSDAGSSMSVANLSYVIADEGETTLPNASSLVAGTFRPTNFGVDELFPAPAPAAPYNSPTPAGESTLAGVFAGGQANGTWNLYVMDDTASDSGSLAGVCLEIGRTP